MLFVFVALLLYLSLYTWNLRTGHLDAFSENTGLEFVGLVLKPGKWVKNQVVDFWDRYIYLIGVRQENEELKQQVSHLTSELNRFREEAKEAMRLRDLLSLAPPEKWSASGARVMAHRLGPHAALETLLVDKGYRSGAEQNDPVVTHQGVVGRILRDSAHLSTVLLLTDPNSRIPVRGRTHRTTGILAGGGQNEPLEVLYIPLNAPLEQGEILITSGLAGIFPQDLPAAKIISIERSDISLFQTVRAEPLLDLKSLEEVLFLKRSQAAVPNPALPAAEKGATAPKQE